MGKIMENDVQSPWLIPGEYIFWEGLARIESNWLVVWNMNFMTFSYIYIIYIENNDPK